MDGWLAGWLEGVFGTRCASFVFLGLVGWTPLWLVSRLVGVGWLGRCFVDCLVGCLVCGLVTKVTATSIMVLMMMIMMMMTTTTMRTAAALMYIL